MVAYRILDRPDMTRLEGLGSKSRPRLRAGLSSVGAQVFCSGPELEDVAHGFPSSRKSSTRSHATAPLESNPSEVSGDSGGTEIELQ